MGGKLRRGAPKEESTVCRPNRRLLGESWVGKLEQFFEIPVDVKSRCFQAQSAWKLFQTLGMVSTVCVLDYSTTNRDSKEIILLGMTQTR